MASERTGLLGSPSRANGRGIGSSNTIDVASTEPALRQHHVQVEDAPGGAS